MDPEGEGSIWKKAIDVREEVSWKEKYTCREKGGGAISFEIDPKKKKSISL